MNIYLKHHTSSIATTLRTLISAILVITAGMPVEAQYYNTGQDPASLRWLHIDTERFRLIYPKTYAQEGIRFAETLDNSFSSLETLFGNTKFKIPIIIHSYSAETNGYVSWAPKRMEIYPAPGHDILPWDTKEQISIHEAVHVYELAYMNRGFSKAMNTIFGQQFIGVLSAMLPMWYMEGNAVFAETALTGSGRGRDPAFINQLKAEAIEGKLYSYDMAVNGSYKRYVPNHYHTGYLMTTFALVKNGMNVWNNVLDFTARYPFTLNPVNAALAKNVSTSKKKLYYETFDTLAAIWRNELNTKQPTPHTTITPPKHGQYINYTSPVTLATGTVAAIREQLGKPYYFTLIDTTGRETHLHTPGQMRNQTISHGAGKITWVEYNTHPRWENLTYSNIKILDIKTRRVKSLTHKSRYFASAISPDGKLVAAAENTTTNHNNLVIIDTQSGTIQHTIPTPHNAVIQHPQFNEKGTHITCIALHQNLESIITYSLQTHTWQTTLPSQPHDIQSATIHHDTLFYIMSMPDHAATNIFIRTPAGETHRITDTPYGVKDIFTHNNTITYSTYTALGYEIHCTPTNTNTTFNTSHNNKSHVLLDHFTNLQTASDTTTTQYTPQPYRKHRNLINIHSWMPFYVDIDQLSLTQQPLRPGAMIMSQNHLSTLTATAGYEHTNNNENILHTKLEYTGLLPIIETQIDVGQQQEIYTPTGITESMQRQKTGFRALAAARIPLIYHHGAYTQIIQPSATIEYRNSAIYNEQTASYRHGRTSTAARLYIANTHRTSPRDIYPRHAQIIDLSYQTMPHYYSSISLRTAIYLPGLMPNNTLRLRYETEKHLTQSRLTVSNRIQHPRGYTNIISRQLTILSADYTLPIAYPDINLASLIYIKRLRATLFADHARGHNNSYYNTTPSGTIQEYAHTTIATYRSFGLEALADLHTLRLPFLISCGIQAAWKNTTSPPILTALFTINIFGTSINNHP